MSDMTVPTPEVRQLATPEWRVGRHYPVHVYEGDTPVATFFTAQDAERAVRAVNRAAVPTPDVDIPVEAIEAAAIAICPGEYCEGHDDCRIDAERALAAAMPHLRAQIADQIEALQVTFSREHWAMELQHGIVLDAARVARGGSDGD